MIHSMTHYEENNLKKINRKKVEKLLDIYRNIN